MAKTDQAQRRLVSIYDRFMGDPLQAAFFGNSGYYNYGYSTDVSLSQREACENLVEKLLEFIPEKHGAILDVACGQGASTRHLLAYYRPEDVTGINISDWQLEQARKNAPGCLFLNMDAVQLDFTDASFDAVICVESAFHFNTRERFLAEALRVLKPGGWLVLSDILGRVGKDKKANALENPAAYKAMLSRLGFANPQVIDATEPCTRSCGRRLRRWPAQERRAGRLGLGKYIWASVVAQCYALYMRWSQRYYLLVGAQKPL